MGKDETIYGVDAASTTASPLAGMAPILQKNTLNVNPMLVSSRGYALLWDNPGHMTIDAGTIDERGTAGRPIPATCVFDTNGRQGGLTVDFFADPKLLESKLKRFDVWTSFDWQYGSPAPDIPPDGWSARWTGSILTGPAGTYGFVVNADDGARLWINNIQVLDAWQPGPSSHNSGQAVLPGYAMMPIRLEYYDTQQKASVQLNWRPPAQLDRTMAWEADSAEALDYYFVYGPTTSDAILACMAAVSKPPPPVVEPVPAPAPAAHQEPPPPVVQPPVAPAPVAPIPLPPAPKPEVPDL